LYLITLNNTNTHTHTHTHGPTQKPLPVQQQYSQANYIHATGGIRTRNSSNRANTKLRLRPRSQGGSASNKGNYPFSRRIKSLPLSLLQYKVNIIL